ncbi:hypothetical protein CDAR_55131 [Caerostris darwini]|uniref:Uncharacterized protein n=1 Tax=Caerostris darwini TaxID=1538125 RepID=A0AAV4PF58_9ARAC|nr:hypothetical protein CDAR_55131 [Caerostris darwini]
MASGERPQVSGLLMDVCFDQYLDMVNKKIPDLNLDGIKDHYSLLNNMVCAKTSFCFGGYGIEVLLMIICMVNGLLYGLSYV